MASIDGRSCVPGLRAPRSLREALLWPKRHVKPEFVSWRFRMGDGRTIQGYKRIETTVTLEVFDPTSQKTELLIKSEIDEQLETGTLMPDGLAAAMTPAQRRDLMRLLILCPQPKRFPRRKGYFQGSLPE